MNPAIEILDEKKLVGLHMTMSLTDNKTNLLWKKFMPLRKEIPYQVSNLLYSMQIYDPGYFLHFSPTKEYIKWACAEVSEFVQASDQMEPFILPGGLYAVFKYKGLSTDNSIFKYIFSTWLPLSGYVLDDRPHFELLDRLYKNNDPDSEESIHIPIKLK